MNLGNLIRIAKKDWKEILGNKQLRAPLMVMPVIFGVILPLSLTAAGNDQFNGVSFFQLVDYMLKPILLLIPAIFSLVIASDSISGEKERKTIESLLVLPLSDREIIIGKVFASLFPALVATLLAFFAMGLTINLAAAAMLTGQIIIFTDPTWWLLLILIVPILAFMSTLFMVLISSIAKDVRSAQQYSLVVVLPVVSLIFLGEAHLFILNIKGELAFAIVAALVAIFLTILTTKRLNRERLVLAIS
ncbi:MAG TPA: ABC transporter permease subunit [Candidatus Lokiarchaeia archaeon]|nr:ABC transporter permease subunit [Candidatus Lokiarchaeia archaeon]